MSNAIQMDNSSPQLQLALPVKRRRGRPRKDQSPSHRRDAPIVPPGMERNTQNPAHQVDAMVGQAVTGIIEASFDAGFLLSVTIGDSKTKLRGIVFKPGHYVPITSENDIAPHVEMIHRNEIRLPVGNKVRRRRRYKHKAEFNESKDNQLSTIVLAPSVPPVGARGTVVPVVLQPANLTNRLARSGQEPLDVSRANVETLRGKSVQMFAPLAMLPPDGSTSMISSHGVENVQNQRRAGEETNPLASRNNEVIMPGGDSDRSHGYTQPTQSSSVRREKKDMNERPSTEPLEVSDSKNLLHYGTGNMTKLLQVMQEKMVGNKEHESDSAAGLKTKS
ncbi:unnamed protein product [Cuscuta campestris]|uniref:AT hook motif-containing protein n=1 Tax=Cuscuta campestris TaxID=132261 RepID=A0A484MSI5_9ASTE|nr:unnamed protein product [Cuscuta campestris]